MSAASIGNFCAGGIPPQDGSRGGLCESRARKTAVLEQLQTTSNQACLDAGIDPELPIQVLDMILHGMDRHDENGGNFLIAVSSNQQSEHALLLPRKGLSNDAFA